ncbi:MAG: hypothetical protein EHM81_02575, partial [Chloroflexi bacterium]
MNKTSASRFAYNFLAILLFACLMLWGLGFNKGASAQTRRVSMDTRATVITPALTVTLMPTVSSTLTVTKTPGGISTPTPTLTATRTPTLTLTSHPGQPTLLAPDNGAVLPQPVAPNQWHFAWDARKGPCYCTITIQGPGVQISQQVNYYDPGGYTFVYQQPTPFADNQLSPWSWAVGVTCPLGSNGSGPRAFSVAPFLTLTPTPTPDLKTFTVTSTGAYDGWILESMSTSGRGGSLNSTGKTFRLGDDAFDRQYRAILSFNTALLPSNAAIQSATLRIKQSGSPVGSSPFTSLGKLLVDIKTGTFGKINLEAGDFQAPSTLKKVGSFGKTAVGGWYSVSLSPAGISKIDRSGVTQFRLYFTNGDNGNSRADFMKFFSGNSATGKPGLIITYTL